ncbi:MAG TPA: GntR family transcriptional regulator [Victivallales bacterium]|nr:GntR family transcriptional regulator [Victivallales bacterium]
MFQEFRVQSKTEQVRKYIKDLIDSQILKPGDQLIPEDRLAQKLGISLVTVRRGLDLLVKDNLIHRIQGKGTFTGPQKVTRTLNINLVYPNSPDSNPEDPFFGQILNGINQYLAGKSIRLGLSPISQTESFAKVLQDNQWRSFLQEGAIFMNYKITEHDSRQIKKYGIPLVNIGNSPMDTGLFSVDVDHELGGYLATSHLIKHGRKRILVLSNSQRHFYTDNVINGYKKALQENNLNLDKKLLYDQAESEETPGYELMAELLNKLDFDAVMNFGSLATIGIINCLHQRKKRIPEDIAFVSYNDFPIISQFNHPTLTAVSQPIKDLGFHAAKLLLDIKDGKISKSTGGKKILLKPELIIRRSCGCS